MLQKVIIDLPQTPDSLFLHGLLNNPPGQGSLPEQLIPVEAFCNPDLGILESAIRYLRDVCNYRYCRISEIINRDARTVWVSFMNAIKKEAGFKYPDPGGIFIPCSIFWNRSLGPLEAITIYLHDKEHIAFRGISGMLRRAYSTITNSYYNGTRKR